ncbi:hypothetical protein DRN87_03910 [Candidatus Geothermarchaeota archaeon]|nr:MAG: hypothetical protein DRN87_03910 [Candidatus Geothermarchaeota archaeon]HEW93129.1 DUF106 domain-containing protein [Thermoprotei archaeon]
MIDIHSPLAAIFVILGVATIMNLISFILNKYLVYTPDYIEKRKMINQLRREYNELRGSAADSKEAKKLEKKLKTIQKMESELMMKSFRPFIFTLVIFWVMWWWLSQLYSNMGSFIYLPVPLPMIGLSLNYFWWYLISSLAVGALIKRALYPQV